MDSKARIILENISSRRSIRKYKDQAICQEKLKLIIEAGECAPSAANIRSRDYTIVDTKEEIEFLKDYIFSSRKKQNNEYFKNVPVMILLTIDEEKYKKNYQRGSLYSVISAALAGQNMMLMANALGISSCWVGQTREYKIISHFSIKKGHKLVGVLAFGYDDD